jgi:uncharacterized protein
VPHISLVTLAVDDVDAASRFYEGLGWHRSEASVPGTVAFLRGGTGVLGLYGRGDLGTDAGVEVARRGDPVAGALATNLPSPAAVDSLLAAVHEHGGRVVRPASATEWGGYSGYFTDPDGHLWEVAHNPGFALHPDGTVTLPDDGR